MAGLPMVTVEIDIKPNAINVGTMEYVTRAADTPASTRFEARIADDLTFRRSVGCHFWGEKPRGAQNFGVLSLVNADGRFDSLVGQSLRDTAVVVRRGESNDAFSTFTIVATLLIDRIDFESERILKVYLKDSGAKLERALQQTLYPTTVSNGALRGRPRPITVGTCYQVPLAQPDVYGNGRFDVHDADTWIGVDQVLDQGTGLIEGTAYRRAITSGIFGVERTNAIGGAQCATVQGAFNIAATPITDDFTSLAGWTETNGGVAGRDASIVSNELRMQNTAGGADLILTSTTTVTAVGTDVFFYELDCTNYTSGQCELRIGSGATVASRVINAVGRWTGVVRSAVNFQVVLRAQNGSNCDLRIDNLRIRRVTLIERLPDVLTYLCVTKGPLLSSDLDSAAITALGTAAPYRLGVHASEPVQIADVLDRIMTSYGGWWYVNRLGKLTVGRLTAPSGSPAYTFDASSIAPGMSVRFDMAQGLSTVILAQRNWQPYEEAGVVPALNSVTLSPTDRDPDVTVSGDNYNYATAGAGSVRSTPGIAGGRYYFEVRITTLSGNLLHAVGVANATAAITGLPGTDTNAFSYRASGDTLTGGVSTAYGTAWSVNDLIGVAVDMRPAANGSRQQHVRIYFRRNGTWQNSSNPDTEAAYAAMADGVTGVAHFVAGVNTAIANAGTVNFGQSAFTHAPPDDYIAPAWHRQTIIAEYRFRYSSPTAVAPAYAQAVALGTSSREEVRLAKQAGTPTLLSRHADARTECDRWASLYSVERFFYSFTGLLPAGVAVDQIEPGDVVSVTYPRFGLAAKLLRVVSVEGDALGRSARITAWG